MDPEADRLLLAFAKTANRSLLHPTDWQRFHKFVIDVHIWGRKVSDVEVRQRLEELGFAQPVAAQLASFCAEARHLLAEYDGAKGAGS